MARFAVGRPIETREPFIEVDPGLNPGTHRFQLEVVTDDGRVSPADVATVTVVDGRTTDPIVLRDIVNEVLRTSILNPFRTVIP